ncbi:hypothetical protein EX30DRAFT_85710 [Ascodesmis nigricans]|uniref:Uncharacterized protein n=1 Tax=Ascodesmis nigricans TaxID=341454 RepID=A0A4S2N347_9PEZI|nr:hypothetical protein EX30DRAFT_85710 [Ascodesmis nigricans]
MSSSSSSSSIGSCHVLHTILFHIHLCISRAHARTRTHTRTLSLSLSLSHFSLSFSFSFSQLFVSSLSGSLSISQALFFVQVLWVGNIKKISSSYSASSTPATLTTTTTTTIIIIIIIIIAVPCRAPLPVYIFRLFSFQSPFLNSVASLAYVRACECVKWGRIET